jgi:hypothetical protein
MAVQVGKRAIPTDPANVAKEKTRLDQLSLAEKDEEIKDAKGVIGTQIRAGYVGQASHQAAETLEAAGITNVVDTDPDLTPTGVP